MSGTLIESQPSAQRGSERRADAWWAVAVCGFLVLAVLILFSRTLNQGFCSVDDNFFIFDEPHVSGGLSWSGIAWTFTNGPLGEWYPLSMLSHMLDCQLYGLHPAGHHLTNLLLHAASAVALFLVLWRMTGALWPSALVAAVFALHPLHVEPVAWLASRRDVLSGLFFMLTLGAYGEYVRHPRSPARYLAVVGLFALGLMAKPMLVTIPPLLLLLDFWPFGRFRRTQPDAAAPSVRQKTAAPSVRQKTAAPTSRPAPFPWRPILDKLPLFALCIADAAVTMRTHGLRADDLTLPDRLANAVVSYVTYLGQLFVPVGLSIFNSHPEAGRPAWQIAAAVVLLLAISAAAVIGRRSYPYFFVGWFWYVGMLVPVLGLAFVGPQSRADRYTYLSQIGLYIALVWGAMRLGASWPARRWVFGIGSALVLAAMMAGSWRQIGFWQDDKTLWEHALACDPKNATAHYFLGTLLEARDESGAIAHYRQALEIDPDERNIYSRVRTEAHNALGNLAARKGDIAGAIAYYEQTLESDADFVPAHTNLGGLLARKGDFDEAMLHFKRSIELSPGNASAYCNMAVALAQHGMTDEAIASFRKALEADPKFGIAHSSLATLLAERDAIDEAIVHLRRAIEIDPDAAVLYQQMAGLLRKQGKTSEAAKYNERGIKASRRYAETQDHRGMELAQQGKISEAIAQFQTAIAVAPDYAQAHCNLADALGRQGNLDAAISHYRRALEIDPNFAPARQGLDRLSNR
jgi:tetratricopeptide (TPR) repeat protein